MKKKLYFTVIMLCFFVLTGCKSGDYKTAQELLANEQYKEAIVAFEALGDYKSSVFFLEDAKAGKEQKEALEKADQLYKDWEFDQALAIYQEFPDVPEAVQICEELEPELEAFHAVYDIYLRWEATYDGFERLTQYTMDTQYEEMKAISDDFKALDLDNYPELSAYRTKWEPIMYGIDEIYKIDCEFIADEMLQPAYLNDTQLALMQSEGIYKEFISQGLDAPFPIRYGKLIAD